MGALPLLAQDVLPEKSRPDRHSGHVSDSEAMQQLMRFVEVSNPMPAGFKGTTENTIIDPTHELEPFWQKLSVLDRPLRIVHIGDSHVRGHVYPILYGVSWKTISDGRPCSICR